MSDGFLTLAYLLAAGLFILSLAGLSKQHTARRGARFGVAGMTIAVVATLLSPASGSWWLILPVMGAGAWIGLRVARGVAMTQMPELTAALHSFVGLAAVLVGVSTYLDPGSPLEGAQGLVHAVEVYADVVIGAITFTGSVVAWAKLAGHLSGAPTLLPGRHKLNLIALGILAVLLLPVMLLPGGTFFLIVAALLAGTLGAHLVLAIGGADMPVVVSLLNSYSGWTAAAAGFMLSNDLLIITGALVGSSGAILSYIMCRAMNRSVVSVVLGGFGTSGATASADAGDACDVQSTDPERFAALLAGAKEVLIVPGYGLAVARAQNAVHDLVRALQARGARVRFVIHPVAGRLPGHMNVLLAEAGVSYDLVHEMDEVNEAFQSADVAMVVGANDIVNPGAQTDDTSPIYGMPVIEAWKARHCVVLKRSMSNGYAGVGNPLFSCDNTQMLFGDAKDSVEAVVHALRSRSAA